MNRKELKESLINTLKKVCSNVETNISHPSERANTQSDFPYITVVWRDWKPDSVGNVYGKQLCDIIAIVYGEDKDLLVRSADLEEKIIGVLFKNEDFKNNIITINPSNLFQPFGINAGVFPPYAGFRVEIEIANVKLT
jgi:hypothetical protein